MKSSVTVAALGALLLTVYLKRRTKKRPPLPPGPPADPLIGHLRIMPTDKQELVFHEWSKTYELLEKRSALYSDRPNFTVYVMMGWDPDVAFLPYGSRFRKHRKLLHSHFTQQAIVQFQPIQLQNAHILAKGLLENKGDYHHLLSRYTTAIVMRIAYGHQILSDDDEFIQAANDSGYAQNNGGPPGGTMVDLFPILQYFPSWFPGTYYATFAREWRWAVEKLYTLPYEHWKPSLTFWQAQGTAEPSFLATQLEAVAGQTLGKEDIEDLKGSAGIIFGAGAETTWSSLESFILVLLHYPEVQKKGQEEIDRVVGSDRLPTFEDYDSLPYIECVTQEILRWHPSVPIGVPHRSTEDDIYRGMFIPKGSVIFANAKGMALDESIYAEPTKFNPDRFLPKSQGGNEEPHLGATFGFGRRICPGRHLATASIWIAVATIFATVNITKARDEYGNEITPEIDFETGITSEHGQAKFRPIQLQNACLLAQGLMQNTKGYQHLVGRYTTAIVIRIAYGHQILSDDDIFVQTVHDCGYTLNNGGPPGGTVVDFFPILMQLPSWFPGTYYANFARNWRWAVDKLYNQPYEYVQEQRTKGMAQPSFLLDQLEATSGQTLTDEEIGDIKGSSGVIFGAGAETVKDEAGNEMIPELEYETGLTSRPKHFPCNTAPRSDKAARLVANECDALL
ncbi:hypothetical protein EYR40_001458 [Pleurotus pulmonarius]|nr:hypothetical protein EYR40_001458 [Pleurotus pulmonarius]